MRRLSGGADARSSVTATGSALGALIWRPSTVMDSPQRLHAIRARLPRTFASGISYWARQLSQATLMGDSGRAQRSARRSTIGQNPGSAHTRKPSFAV